MKPLETLITSRLQSSAKILFWGVQSTMTTVSTKSAYADHCGQFYKYYVNVYLKLYSANRKTLVPHDWQRRTIFSIKYLLKNGFGSKNREY